ncbi:MAG TPA: flagellar biosynthesis anti-sigma factor FlgM [Gammaproteobacteria bacterium]|nr:flagellar biosynthesis anti-sigma factor FlgM [Gammaproteobacteria bacterium]
MAIDITGFPPPQPQGTGGSTNSATNGSGNTAQAVAPATTASRADTVTLTPQASQLKKVESTIDAQSVVDGERVQNLKSAIDAGMYEINAQRVAEKFIQFENNLRS